MPREISSFLPGEVGKGKCWNHLVSLQGFQNINMPLNTPGNQAPKSVERVLALETRLDLNYFFVCESHTRHEDFGSSHLESPSFSFFSCEERIKN